MNLAHEVSLIDPSQAPLVQEYATLIEEDAKLQHELAENKKAKNTLYAKWAEPILKAVEGASEFGQLDAMWIHLGEAIKSDPSAWESLQAGALGGEVLADTRKREVNKEHLEEMLMMAGGFGMVAGIMYATLTGTTLAIPATDAKNTDPKDPAYAASPNMESASACEHVEPKPAFALLNEEADEPQTFFKFRSEKPHDTLGLIAAKVQQRLEWQEDPEKWLPIRIDMEQLNNCASIVEDGDEFLKTDYSLGMEDIDQVLRHLDWWQEVAFDYLVTAFGRDNDPYKSDRERLIALLDDVLKAFVQARSDSSSDLGTKAGGILLGRYRLFTREIGRISERIYPVVDFQPLLELV